MLIVGSLFSGIGGFDLGLERAGFQIKWQVEIDEWCRKILTKHWPNVPKYGDIKTVGKHNLEPVDLVCGGFPCQPFSQAGKRKGKEDDRYLWPEMLRVISELKPRWVIVENVVGIVSMELDNLLTDLEEIGYETQSFIIPACAVNAPHERKRIWIIGYTDSNRKSVISFNDEMAQLSKTICNHSGKRRERFSTHKVCRESRISRLKDERVITIEWERPDLYPSKLCRSRNGISERLDALGNAVIPQIPEILGNMILEAEKINSTGGER